MSNIEIREASLDDCEQIVKVHVSDIDGWLDENDEFTSLHKTLSVGKRWMKGGPWMSIETCAIHLNSFLLRGYIAFVAILNGKIVGEVEIIPENEPEPYGKHLYIYVFWVHRKFRGRGIGSKMISYVVDFARKSDFYRIVTSPEKGSIKFYVKNDFSLLETYVPVKIAARRVITHIEIDEIPIDSLSKLDTSQYYLVIGRYLSLSSIIFNMIYDVYFLPEVRFEYKVYKINENNSFIIMRKSKHMGAAVYALINKENIENRTIKSLIDIISYLAYKEEIKEINTCIREDLLAELRRENIRIAERGGKITHYVKDI